MNRKFKYITNKKSELITNVTPLSASTSYGSATLREEKKKEVCINMYLKIYILCSSMFKKKKMQAKINNNKNKIYQ